MATTKAELTNAMMEYGEAEGFESLSALTARMLIAFAHTSGHTELKFEDDAGIVIVRPTTRATAQLN